MKRSTKPGGPVQGAAGPRRTGASHDSDLGGTGRPAGHAGKSRAQAQPGHTGGRTASHTAVHTPGRVPSGAVDRPSTSTPPAAGQGAASPVDSVWARSQGGDPAQHRAALEAAAHTLGLHLSAPVFDQLQAYQALLLRWNKVYNLSAIRDADRMRVQHLIDCLAVLPALQRVLDGTAAAGSLPSAGAKPVETAQPGRGMAGGAGQPAPLRPPPPVPHAQALAAPATPHQPPHPAPLKRLLDVGSGGGLPGVVLAIARPDWAVDCVDTVGKKATFIRQVAAELGLPNLRGLHSRVEALAPPAPAAVRPPAAGTAGAGAAAAAPEGCATPTASPPNAADTAASAGYDLITSRAFASLPDFTRLTRHLLRPDGVWAAMKGKVPDDEINGLPAAVSVFHVEHLAVPTLDADRCLVWMRPATGG